VYRLPRELGPLIRTYVNYLLLSRFAPTGLQLRTRLGEIFAAAHSEAESAQAPTRGVFKGTRSDDESLSPNREIERTFASESLRRVRDSRANGRETRPRESRTCPEPAAAEQPTYLSLSTYLTSRSSDDISRGPTCHRAMEIHTTTMQRRCTLASEPGPRFALHPCSEEARDGHT